MKKSACEEFERVVVCINSCARAFYISMFTASSRYSRADAFSTATVFVVSLS
jgi:hypothetical protein